MARRGTPVDRPLARTDGLVIERLEDEIVLYDQVSEMAHCLSADAASVWECCDGRLTPEDIARELDLQPPVVERVVEELDGLGLLDGSPVAFHAYSRREVTTRLAKVGAAAFVAPLIYSVGISAPAWAAGSCFGKATSNCSAQGGHVATNDADCTCTSTKCCYNPHSGTNCAICVSESCVPFQANGPNCLGVVGTCTVASDCCCSYVGTTCTLSGGCTCSTKGACSN
jgi:hypothetical protein